MTTYRGRDAQVSANLRNVGWGIGQFSVTVHACSTVSCPMPEQVPGRRWFLWLRWHKVRECGVDSWHRLQPASSREVASSVSDSLGTQWFSNYRMCPLNDASS